jgi:hypothetical protein
MKAHSRQRVLPRSAILSERRIDIPALLDKSIRPIGTGSVVAGIGAATLGMGTASSYLIAAGVLFHLASRFGDWWTRR